MSDQDMDELDAIAMFVNQGKVSANGWTKEAKQMTAAFVSILVAVLVFVAAMVNL